MSATKTILLILWIVVAIAGTVALILYRDWALENLNTAEHQKQWQEWKEDTKKQNEPHYDEEGNLKNPVTRQTSKQNEIPTLVLMRDHFGMCLAAWLIFGSILYWMLALATVATFTPSPPINTDE